MFAQIKQKAWSERGASLSMALMLALVVTTVTAVALTAATAVAGRYSQLADMDRSYYNVTSASKLFWDEMGAGKAGEGVTVNVVRGCDATQAADGSMTPIAGTWTLKIDDTLSLDGDEADPNAYIALSNANASLFQIVTADLLFRTAPLSAGAPPLSYSNTVNLSQVPFDLNEGPNDAAFGYSYNAFEIAPASDATGAAEKIAPVSVTLRLSEDGTASFVFAEADSSEVTPFRCTVTANVGVSDSAPQYTDIGANKYHVEWITEVSWDAESLVTGGGSYGATS